tara:strand:- start:13812 stop:14594 length:783 start_codon:yes stop_codon:yes gene_type:complete
MRNKINASAILLLSFLSTSTLALGQNGHRIVADIAEEHLTPEAKAALMEITNGDPLAKLATWPDEIRSDKHWDFAKPWHYVSVDDDESFDGFTRSKEGDILKALSDYELQLRDKTLTREEKWQALAFFIHFTGDIHQPLHVGRRDDRGGNDITVKWFGKDTRLHAVWDTSLIAHQKLSYSEYAEFLNNYPQDTVESWQKSDYLDWAKDSKSIRGNVYNLPEDMEIGYQYAYKNTPLLNQQLSKAGVRLAGKLNKIFKAQK